MDILDRPSSLDFQNLSSLTVPQLRSLSDKVGIKIKSRAKKLDIIQQLLEYTKSGTSMNSSPTPVLRRPHKGPRTTSRPIKHTTLSARRAQNALGMTSNQEKPGLTVNSVNPLEWSTGIILKVEERTEDCLDATEPTTAQVDLDAQAHQGTEAVQRPASPRRDGASVTALEVAPVSSPLYRASSDHPSTPKSLLMATAASNVLSPMTLLAHSRSPLIDEGGYSILLGAGVQLRYNEADLCEPTSLAGILPDPDRLYSFWDDTSSVWERKSPLVVRTIPVAIKYWKSFYSKFRQQKVWDSIKQNWHSFRILMHEYEKQGKDGFRAEWSRNGKLIPSCEIVATLRSKERDRNQELTNAAQQKYSGQAFDKLFTYKLKNGSTRVLTSPSAIAKRYIKLQL